jgi:hypothetical protein
MNELARTVESELAAYFEKIGAKVHKWVDPLSDQQFWRTPYSYGNSIGHPVLHLTGNLSYYIGAQIAGTGYVRNRDREFTEADRPSKEEALRKFDGAIKLVLDTIRQQSPENWSAAYSAERSREENLAIVLSCAAHADHHVGQIIYLSTELTSQTARKTGA